MPVRFLSLGRLSPSLAHLWAVSIVGQMVACMYVKPLSMYFIETAARLLITFPVDAHVQYAEVTSRGESRSLKLTHSVRPEDRDGDDARSGLAEDLRCMDRAP